MESGRAGGRHREELAMSDKRGAGGSKLAGTVAAFAAGFVTRKLVTLTWKQITGKEPPSDPQDPQVGIGEALSWAVVMGVAMETARLLAMRAAARRTRTAAGADG
jgi:uncharacterized protein DUF4235